MGYLLISRYSAKTVPLVNRLYRLICATGCEAANAHGTSKTIFSERTLATTLQKLTSWMSLSAAVGTYRTSTGCILPGTLIKGAPSKNLQEKRTKYSRANTARGQRHTVPPHGVDELRTLFSISRSVPMTNAFVQTISLCSEGAKATQGLHSSSNIHRKRVGLVIRYMLSNSATSTSKTA